MKKSKSIRAEVLEFKGNIVKLRLWDEVDTNDAIQKAINGRLFAYLDLFEKDSITDLQRRHFWALCGDVNYYTGHEVEWVYEYLKYQFMLAENLEEYPSLARGAMKKTVASKLIEFAISFCIDNRIPFRKQQWYLTTDISRVHYKLTMKRICWLSGERGDIHHATHLIGMGGNRKVHKHELSTFMCLSRKYHNEIHNIGFDTFCKKHIVKPIKLSEEDLRELGLSN